MFEKLKRLLFPSEFGCLCCSRDVFDNPYLFCECCKKSLPYLTGKLCLHCGDPFIADGNYCKRCKGKSFVCDRAISPFIYKGKITTLVQDLKFEGRKYLAKPLAKFMADCFKHTKLYSDIIVPVPLCDKRFKQRGYNQSELLADELSKIIQMPVSKNYLIRVKETITQTELNFAERQKNLINAFKVTSPDEYKDMSVLLVDDVYTTGATTNECAKALKQAGAKAVYVLTASHTVLINNEEQGEL